MERDGAKLQVNQHFAWSSQGFESPWLIYFRRRPGLRDQIFEGGMPASIAPW